MTRNPSLRRLGTFGVAFASGLMVLLMRAEAEALYVLKDVELPQPAPSHPSHEIHRPFFEDFHARVTRQFIDVPENFGRGRMPRMDDPWDAWLGAAHNTSIRGIKYPWAHPNVSIREPLKPRGLWINLSSRYGNVRDVPVIELELIGLKDPAFPRAYVTETLRMKFLDRTPTRMLDFFERGAIAELQRGAEVTFREEGDRVRLVGAIRARSECLECHAVNENTLMGAFSYRLDFSPRKEPGELDMLEPVEYFPPIRFLE